jgi:hypothetical protein
LLGEEIVLPGCGLKVLEELLVAKGGCLVLLGHLVDPLESEFQLVEHLVLSFVAGLKLGCQLLLVAVAGFELGDSLRQFVFEDGVLLGHGLQAGQQFLLLLVVEAAFLLGEGPLLEQAGALLLEVLDSFGGKYIFLASRVQLRREGHLLLGYPAVGGRLVQERHRRQPRQGPGVPRRGWRQVLGPRTVALSRRHTSIQIAVHRYLIFI